MRGTHQRSQRNNQLNNQRMASQRINQRNKTARNNATVKKDTQVTYYNKNFKIGLQRLFKLRHGKLPKKISRDNSIS